MASVPTILGPDGQPVRREVLTQAIAAPSLASVRSVITGYPADGLNPRRLANILRDADQGDPLRYFELAEQIEERDLHYAGVLGTRKRSVTQLPIQVEAASDDAVHQAHADMVSTWLKRDTLQAELFDLLDAVGKGISWIEIIWDTSSGQWQPARLEWRDPRWFRFDWVDGTTALLRDLAGDVPLPPAKFIATRIAAKSGLPIRSGLARLATWAWLFKSFTLRDWAIFAQNFGQPVRLGKYGPGASEDDKDTLFRAVANIAGDCAAIIPESMTIDFVESANVAAGAGLYLERADWLDQQVSKAVLGQTATTDAIAGGHAVGKQHRQVQEDIARSDAKALAAVLSAQLVRPWIDLEFGPQQAYPRIVIDLPDDEDLAGLTDGLAKLVPLGLRVSARQVRSKLGLDEPTAGEELLQPPPPPVLPPMLPRPAGPLAPALQAMLAAAADSDAVDASVARMLAGEGWEPLVAPIVAGLGPAIAAAKTADEVRALLAERVQTMDVTALTELLARAGFSAYLAGQADEPLSPRVALHYAGQPRARGRFSFGPLADRFKAWFDGDNVQSKIGELVAGAKDPEALKGALGGAINAAIGHYWPGHTDFDSAIIAHAVQHVELGAKITASQARDTLRNVTDALISLRGGKSRHSAAILGPQDETDDILDALKAFRRGLDGR